ncbi:MAG: sugar fermentation stimulation protein SfsA [Gammaproteobacteria bacterium RIFOXYA12_FULL_61_12]|nr:MAG: sugar fermentation stimulation protein SfsA [Gammaproteobacteria bacterium RIFOXYD12_FULL_61_37]OGT93483.1 MAG: sugar fermentation stimulation protein SfsA [Gammaproteobacteria bacterium RIFOXYA12_FULL_61_12]
MRFESPLIAGTLLKRYKRFLADVRLDDGAIVTAHTPNTGSMRGCAEPGSRVWLRDSGNPARKYPLSWELVQTAAGVMAGINTGLANHLVREGIENGVIRELAGYDRIRPEVSYGVNSRIDLLLQGGGRPGCYLEVKNVTLAEAGTAYFPDAVTTRGAKHLRELTAMVEAGHRAVIFFCVQRGDAEEVRPADAIDPAYGQALRDALSRGVEALAYRAIPSIMEIALSCPLPVLVS